MTLFSRRTLKRLLDENASAPLSIQPLQFHAERLNDLSNQSFSFEWEVVILNVLNKVGKVEHERLFEKRKPDIFFTSRQDSNNSFIADIVTVSDEGLEKQEPIRAFENELERIVEKAGLRIGRFTVRFNRMDNSPYRQKPKIKVPKRDRFQQDFFNRNFHTFLKKVREDSGSAHNYAVKTKDIDVELYYEPHQKYFTLTHPANDLVYDVVRNPIYNALRNKARKLKQTGFAGARGVIVCDGGSALFHFRKTDSYGIIIGIDKVINEFFRQNTSIAFALLVFIEIGKDANEERHYHVKTELRENPFHSPLNEDLRNILATLDNLFPLPVIDGRSAASTVKKFGKQMEGWGFYTQLKMNGMSEIKISARTVLGLLAGTINQKEFLEDYGFVRTRERIGPFLNPFALNLTQGKLICEISLEKSEFEDDDYIHFKFGESDAAISPYLAVTKAEPGYEQATSPLLGKWTLQFQFPDGQRRDFTLTVSQEQAKLFGTLETAEGIAHLTGDTNPKSGFKLNLSKLRFENHSFDGVIEGTVEGGRIQASLKLQGDDGTSISFPVTGKRVVEENIGTDVEASS
jgi:hypothetical protein